MTRTRIALFVVTLVGVLCAASPPAHAVWPHPSAVNLPVCTATASQRWAAMTSDGSGGVIIAWMDGRGADWDIYAQRISADGRPLWAADGLPVCAASGTQTFPVITGDGAGGAIIAWEDQRQDSGGAYAQRLSADGHPLWTINGVGLCANARTRTSLAIAPTTASSTGAANGAIVVWEELRNGEDFDLYAQRISPAGGLEWSAEGLAVCLAAGSQDNPVVISDGDGGAIVAWYDARPGGPDIYAQWIYSVGLVMWGESGNAVCAAAGAQTAPAIATDGAAGAIVTWLDYRNDGWDVYAQRMQNSGSTMWGTEGVAVCTAGDDQWYPAVASDGLGGAFVAWQDRRSGIWDIYGQRVSSTGAPGWTVDGLPICTAAGEQTDVQMVPDGVGGVVVAWMDTRGGMLDIYAQRVSAGGASQWTAGGVPICTASADQSDMRLIADATGSGVMAWADRRAGDWDVYAQRVDRWGYLGAEPAIASVRDVPNDEGGRVKLSWDASPLDTDVLFENIGSYRIYRSVPTAEAVTALTAGRAVIEGEDDAPRSGVRVLLRTDDAAQAGYWEYVGSVTGDHLPGYSYLSATTGDSLAGSNPLTAFLVQARSVDGLHWWNSAPDSGYSVDNLPPAAPTGFTGVYGGGRATLAWAASPAADFGEFRLYRGHSADFVPGPGDLVATLTGTDYVDEPGAPYFYKLCAVDRHGNAGPYATLLPGGTADVPGGTLPRTVHLAAPVPNPAPGPVTLRFGLPRGAAIELALHDQQGRRVRTLLSGECAAGEHSLPWDGCDARGRRVPPGLYFVRLEVEGRSLVTRLAVIH